MEDSLHSTEEAVLRYVHYSYPPFLLMVFLATFAVESIISAPNELPLSPEEQKTGPGGKPLPRNKKSIKRPAREIPEFGPAARLSFKCISLVVLLTFVANCVSVIVHALVDRAKNWWCGQHTAVSFHLARIFFSFSSTNRSDL
jgi:hypothetical protein